MNRYLQTGCRKKLHLQYLTRFWVHLYLESLIRLFSGIGKWCKQKQPPEMFFKIGVLKNFFIKKRLQHRCFLVNITKILRTPFFIEHLWLLLPFAGILQKNSVLKKYSKIHKLIKLQKTSGRNFLHEWKLDKDCLVVETIYKSLATKYVLCLNMVKLPQYIFIRYTVAVFCSFWLKPFAIYQNEIYLRKN